jgi:hypothetical protein
MPFPIAFDYPGAVGASRTFGLYAVLVHQGQTLNRGHYYAFCRDSARGDLRQPNCTTNAWAQFDDREVELVSFDELTRRLASRDGAAAYMLFYKHLGGGAVETAARPTSQLLAAVSRENGDALAEAERDGAVDDVFLQELTASLLSRLRCLPEPPAPVAAPLPALFPVAPALREDLRDLCASLIEANDASAESRLETSVSGANSPLAEAAAPLVAESTGPLMDTSRDEALARELAADSAGSDEGYEPIVSSDDDDSDSDTTADDLDQGNRCDNCGRWIAGDFDDDFMMHVALCVSGTAK